LAHWAWDAFFYHVYPLGMCGAPARNDFGAAPVPRLAQLHGWLGHLQDLGVNALYLGPVFESTAHGYDTADYYPRRSPARHGRDLAGSGRGLP